MAETQHYEVNDYGFWVTTEDSANRSTVDIEFPNVEQRFSAEIELHKLRSRNKYAQEANKLYGIDRVELEKALNDLYLLRREEAANMETEQQTEIEIPEVSEEEIERRLGRSGVLDRFAAAAAACSGAVGDLAALKLIALGALSAQLALLPNGKPMTANVIVSAEAGRGKNHLCDTVAYLLPWDFYFPFESASAMSLYYMVENDPTFFKHRWIYPNEAEGVDKTVEIFRPLVSSGEAKHNTVNKGSRGSNAHQEFAIQGPVSLAIPTVRNKVDTQLLTRMLILGLEDYMGRVAAHSRAISAQLSQNYANVDHTAVIQAWQAALRSLADVRRVVLPVDSEQFSFSSDEVSHGARLWSNVLALMCTHAWLEQRNRELIEYPSGERAIVAAPEDYEAVYEIFKATCERSVVNLSEAHRKILDAMHRLHRDTEARYAYFDEDRELWSEEKADSWSYEGTFTQKQIANESGVSQSTISAHKSYLVKSVKLLEESRDGLSLVAGAAPSDWRKDDVLAGFPSPQQVREWWTSAEQNLEASAYSSSPDTDRPEAPDNRRDADQEKGVDKPASASQDEPSGLTGDLLKLIREEDGKLRLEYKSEYPEDEWGDEETEEVDERNEKPEDKKDKRGETEEEDDWDD